MEDPTLRRLTTIRLRADVTVSLPEGAHVLNSWLDHAPGQEARGTVVALVEMAPAGPEADRAWARRWNVATDGGAAEQGERADTT